MRRKTRLEGLSSSGGIMSAMRLLTAEPLARHTTFRVGGPADVLQIESGEELEQLALAGRLPTDVGLLLGGCSNVLISFAVFCSTVLRLLVRYSIRLHSIHFF